MKSIIKWIDKNDAQDITTSTYWNDVELERNKEFWVTDKDDRKLFESLQATGLFDEYRILQSKLEEKSLLRGSVLDVAAGVCWTCALLSKCEQV